MGGPNAMKTPVLSLMMQTKTIQWGFNNIADSVTATLLQVNQHLVTRDAAQPDAHHYAVEIGNLV